MSDPELRCANCGALVSADAEWCGQCYEPLQRPSETTVAGSDELPPTVSTTVAAPAAAPERTDRTDRDSRASAAALGAAAIERTESGTVWTCPVCEQKNAMSLSVCPACGTPFARLFQEPETAPHVEPGTVLALSFLLPGLGHWKLGRKGDAVARMVLFAWSFGTVLVLAFARSGKGLGPVASLFLLFVGSTLILWLVSALDAYRIASDERPFVSSRMLLWASAGLVVVSAIVATLVALPAARGQ